MNISDKNDEFVCTTKGTKEISEKVQKRIDEFFAFAHMVDENYNTLQPGEQTIVTCPLCNGTVDLSRVKSNGHFRAMCRNCKFSAME